MKSWLVCCVVLGLASSVAPSAFAKNKTGNPGKGNQPCWQIPTLTLPVPADGYFKNPGKLFKANKEFGNPKQLASDYQGINNYDYANVGDLIDRQCGADAVTEN